MRQDIDPREPSAGFAIRAIIRQNRGRHQADFRQTDWLLDLINAHAHGDHTGGNKNFAKLGVTIPSRDQLCWRARPSLGYCYRRSENSRTASRALGGHSDGPVTIHLVRMCN
jgi:glyoxylase-like metal-dependent hydrolase (beta-lactamase superfamily II)